MKLKILHDGAPLGGEAGEDIDIQNGESVVTVKEDGLYCLIEKSIEHNEHTLEIIIEEPGLRVYFRLKLPPA